MAIKKRWITEDEKKAIPFVLPGVLLSASLIIYPLVYIITMSFRNNSFGQSGFAGINNYLKLFKNPMFSETAMNTLVWTVSVVIASFLIGLFLALLINNNKIKFKGFWRSLIFIAWIVPGVVKATTWKWIYTSDGGLVNHILQSIGFINEPIPWLTSTKYAMLAVVIVQVWSCAPYVMVMLTAGIQQIPKEIYESSDLDGANTIQRLFKITLPMIKDVSFICILMIFIWAINEFALIWIMTSGGPMGSTSTLSLLVYNQFKVLNMNAASASAVMQLIISMIFAGVYVKMVIKED